VAAAARMDAGMSLLEGGCRPLLDAEGSSLSALSAEGSEMPGTDHAAAPWGQKIILLVLDMLCSCLGCCLDRARNRAPQTDLDEASSVLHFISFLYHPVEAVCGWTLTMVRGEYAMYCGGDGVCVCVCPKAAVPLPSCMRV